MARYPGNIRKFPTTNPTQSSAPGVWTMSEQIDSQRRGIWPAERDPYYNYTALHIPGNIPFTSGPNSINKPLAYNSDASPNNFNIVQNGDVRATNFHPYQNNYSSYAPGNCYVDIASNSGFNLSDNADFTIEFFINCPSTSGALWIASGWQNTSNLSWSLSWRSNNAIEFYGRQSSGGAGTIYYVNNSGNNTVLPDTWTHYAVVRNSSTISVYVNGNLINRGAVNGTPAPSTNCRFFGDSLNGSQLVGYISNFRFSRSAVYTQPFIPPTQPLTTTSQGASNVIFLGFNKNRFVDLSNNLAFTFTSGNPAISTNSPFVEYDTTSGSGYFKGSTSVWLNAPDNAALELGSNDFTIECWVYSTADFSSNRIFTSKWNNFVFGIIPTPVLYFAWYGNTNGSATGTLISTALNVWHHFAVCRQGNTLYMFQNGQKLTQSTSSITSTLNNDSYGTMIGGNESVVGGVIASANEPWYGYISDYRFVNGTALYTASFTLPTRPLTAVSNTSLLTLQTRAPANNNGFIDSSPNNFLITRNGNTTQGSFTPYSPTGFSYYTTATNTFDLPGSVIAFGSGSFTIESWCYMTYSSGGPIVYPYNSGNGVTSGGFSIGISVTGIGTYAVNGATPINYVATLETHKWYHVALVKDGSASRLYVDGQLVATGTDSTTYTTPTGGARIGGIYNLSQTYGLVVNNLRIVTNQALYSSNFTPSSSNLNGYFIGHRGLETTPITGTVKVLTAIDRYPLDRSFNNLTISRSNTPQIIPISPFAPTSTVSPLTTGGSSYYDSSGDYLSIASNPALSFSGDFCIEAWAYPTSSTFGIAYKYVGGNVGSSEWYFVIDGTWQLSIALDGGGGEDYFRTSSNTITPYAWNHCVVTRSGTAVRLFINGILQSYNTTSRTLNATGTQVVVGGNSNFLSGLRITKDTIPILYQTSHTSTSTKVFDPPTSPPTAIPGTSLLLNFTNASLVDVTGKTNFETSGQVQVSTSQTKFNYLSGGSAQGYTSSGNGFLRGNILSNWIFLHDGSTWTIEFWIYPTTLSGFQGIFCTSGAGSDYVGFHAAILNGGTITASQVRGVSGSATNFTSNTSLVVNSWNYVGITFLSSTKTCSFYINGAAAGSSSNTGFSYSSSNPTFLPHIGQTGEPTYPYYFNGYISDLRVTRGIARNVSSIPTRPFALA